MSTPTRLLSVVLSTLLLAPPVHAGTDPADACKDSKAKEAGKKAAAVMKAVGKNIKKSDPAKLASSISKAQSKLTKGFAKAESKGGCLTTGDVGAIEAKVDAFVTGMVEDLGPQCGNGVRSSDEQCDGADAPDCPGLCQPNCICPAPRCGNGVVEVGESCDPPCDTGSCGPGMLCGVDCACVPAEPCNCGAPEPTRLAQTIVFQAGTCGAIEDAADTTLVNLGCGETYVGGGQLGAAPVVTSVPIGAFPSQYNIECCYGTTLALTGTTAADTGSDRTCTSAGCVVGGPVPTELTPAPLSVCTQDSVVAQAFGSANCATGQVNDLYLPVLAPVFLTGDVLQNRCDGASANQGAPCSDDSECTGGTCVVDSDVQPCPICNPITLVCNGGPNDGMACTPGTPAAGPAYPTSHDCPADPSLELQPSFQPFSLTTGTVTREALDGQFCGFCRDNNVEGSGCFEGDEDPAAARGCPDSSIIACQPESDGDVSGCNVAIPCNTDADCYAPYESCEQRHAGASNEPTATEIIQNGVAPGDLTDGQAHPATLVSIHCVPPTLNELTDTNADFPGPGSTARPGTLQLLP